MRKNKNAEQNTETNVPRNKNVKLPTRKNVQRNKNAKLLTPKSVNHLTITKRNVRKFLMSNVTMSTNVTMCPNKNVTMKTNATRCLKKNATMLMYPNALTSPNNIVLITLCLIAKRYPIKNVTRSIRTNVTMKKNMSLTKKRKLDVSGLHTELALMTPNVNFTKFFCGKLKISLQRDFFPAFDDEPILKILFFSNLMCSTHPKPPTQPPPAVNY
jgi:hypothetical protein